MKLATLIRDPKQSDEQGTFGLLIIGNVAFHTGELPWKNNQHGVSCIPTGTYTAQWTKSPHFPQGTFQLMNVPNRDGIRIHIGNWCGDTDKGWFSDVEGCILLGMSDGARPCGKNGGKLQKGVFESTVAIGRFQAMMGVEPFEIEVRWKW